LFVLLMTAGAPLNGWSCEPIVPLYYLLSGSSLAGVAILPKSLWWLAAAVAVKCTAFVCFEKRLPWGRAAVLMLVANVVSTVPGVLLAVLISSVAGVGIVVAMPLVFGLGWMVQRRVNRLSLPKGRLWISGWTALAGFVVFSVLSIALYGRAATVLNQNNYPEYWVFKFLFVTLVACGGIIMSAVLEECVIAGMARGSARNVSFYASVFRANYITLGLILFVAAIRMLPERLRSPDFISSLLEDLWNAAGQG
jgi:hypothetical protein